jgi:hypothetical protein
MAALVRILPDPTRAHLVRLTATEEWITAVVETTQATAVRPCCGSASSRMRSH